MLDTRKTTPGMRVLDKMAVKLGGGENHRMALESAIGMGFSAAIVLVCSNIVISALRKVIPSKVRIPCYICLLYTSRCV